MCLLATSMSSLEKCLTHILPIFWLGFFFFFNMEFYELFIYLDINPLLVKLFASIFYYFTGCIWILSMVSFTIQKFLSLIRSHLFISAFLSFA